MNVTFTYVSNFWLSYSNSRFIVARAFLAVAPGMAEGLKIWGASSIERGIICPPLDIGITDLPKSARPSPD